MNFNRNFAYVAALAVVFLFILQSTSSSHAYTKKQEHFFTVAENLLEKYARRLDHLDRSIESVKDKLLKLERRQKTQLHGAREELELLSERTDDLRDSLVAIGEQGKEIIQNNPRPQKSDFKEIAEIIRANRNITKGVYTDLQQVVSDLKGLASKGSSEDERAGGIDPEKIPEGLLYKTLGGREYLIYVPKEANFGNEYSGKRFPVVFIFHGSGGKPDSIAKKTRYHELAKREGFIAVFPNSQFIVQGGQLWKRWDVTNEQVKDVTFISNLVDELVNSYPVDESRIFATGMSNGSTFTQAVGCGIASIAAIGPVAGARDGESLETGCAKRKNPLPFIGFYGTEDDKQEKFEKAFAYFVARNSCSVALKTTTLPDTNPSDGTTVDEITPRSCDNPTYYYKIKGGGHFWPGGFYDKKTVAERPGVVTKDISATELTWSFFNNLSPQVEEDAPLFLFGSESGTDGHGTTDAVAAIEIDNSGSVITAGTFYGNATIGGHKLSSSGKGDIFVYKTTALGETLWALRAGDKNEDAALDIALDSKNNIYVSGKFIGNVKFGKHTVKSNGGVDAFVAKISPTGKWLWVRNLGGEKFDSGNKLAVDRSGNITLGLLSQSKNLEIEQASGQAVSLPNGGSSDSYILRANSQGKILWVGSVNGSGNERIRALDIDQQGNSFAGVEFTGSSVVTDGNSRYEITSSGGTDVLLIKFENDGSVVTDPLLLGSSRSDGVGGIDTDSRGNIYVSGRYSDRFKIPGARSDLRSSGKHDNYLVILSNNLNKVLDVITLQGATDTSNPEVLIDHDDNLFLSGDLEGSVVLHVGSNEYKFETPTKNRYPYLIALSSDRNYLWSIIPEMAEYAASSGLARSPSSQYTTIAKSIQFRGMLRVEGNEFHTHGPSDQNFVVTSYTGGTLAK